MIKKKLKELLEFAQTTDLQELVWEKKGVQISFRRTPSAPPPAVAPVGVQATDAAGEPAKPLEVPVIRSTMVGTFFRSDSPDRPPLVVEGTIVTVGQPVASIEAMKIMKDVVSPMPCRIVKALLPNGHTVEYGQPLFEVEPMAESDPANV